MSFLRKSTLLIFVVSIFYIFMIYLSTAYADNIYPLEAGEILLEERVIDESCVEIFTELDNDFYFKKLERTEDTWIIKSTEIIYPKWTGLDIAEVTDVGDRELASALERELKGYGMDLTSLPQVVDHSNSEYLPPIGTQYEDSCVGWSTGYYLRTYQQAKDIGWKVKDSEDGIDSHIFSPTFIYNQINNGIDGGAYIEDAGDLLVNIGAATLEAFPYIPGDYYTTPSQEVIDSAAPHKIRNWRILYTEYDSHEYIIQKTREYLNTGDLIVSGSRIGFKFQYPYIDGQGNSIITTENYPSYKHAYVIVGYDDTLVTFDGVGAFKILNSWGKEWGNEGFSYISYEAYAANVIEGFVFTDLPNGEMVDDIKEVNYEIISPTQVRITWESATNAEGYKIFDENLNEMTSIANPGFTIVLNEPSEVKRYVQAFNSISTSNVFPITFDTRDLAKIDLDIDISSIVTFNLNFSGNGRYDIQIKDDIDTLIFEDNNLQGKHGSNLLIWDGKDMEGNSAADGEYKLSIIPYKNGTAKDAFILNFTKSSKVENASSAAYAYDNIIQYVEIPIAFKSDGILNISITYNDITRNVIIDQAVNAGETKVYKINKRTFDFNNKNLDKIKLEIDIR